MKLKQIVMSVAIGGGAFVIGWVVSPGEFTHYYRVSQPFVVLDRDGFSVGVIPKGTLLLSNAKMRGNPDVPWRGLCPIEFVYDADATRYLEETDEDLHSALQYTLFVDALSQDLPPVYGKREPPHFPEMPPGTKVPTPDLN